MGTYAPDGRVTDPAQVLTSDPVSRTLSGIDGPGNGAWTLFFADMSGGDTSTLVSWGLQIEAVPEPTTWALIVFASIVLVESAVRWFCARRVSGFGVPPLNGGVL